jgi:hypothetical protein
MGALDPARPREVTVDAVGLDQPGDEIRHAANHLDKTFTFFRPEPSHQLVGIILQAWNDLAAVPAGRPGPDRVSFQHHRVYALLGKMQACR